MAWNGERYGERLLQKPFLANAISTGVGVVVLFVRCGEKAAPSAKGKGASLAIA
jgi:hypothetical protein